MALTMSISQSTISQSISANSSYIKTEVKMYSTYGSWDASFPASLTIDGTKYSYTGSFPEGTTSKTIYTKYKTIYHDDDGTKTLYSSAVAEISSSSGTIYASKTYYPADILRQSALEVGYNIPVEEPFDFNITKYNSDYTDKIIIRANSESGTVIKTIEDVEDGDSVTLNASELDTLYKTQPNWKFITVYFTIYSYDGTTLIGSNYDAHNYTINCVPTITSFTYVDENPTTASLVYTELGQFIKGYSTMKVENLVSAGVSDSTITSVVFGGTTYTYANFIANYPSKSNWSESNVEVSVIDSRTRTASKSYSVDLIEYTPITKDSITITRTGNINEETTLYYKGNWWNESFPKKTNSLTVSYKYKKTSDSTYTTGTSTITPTFTDGTFEFTGVIKGDLTTGFTIADSFNVIVTVSDELSSKEFEVLLNSGIPAISIYKNNVAIHGAYDESLGGTQFNGDTYLNGQPLANPNLFMNGNMNVHQRGTSGFVDYGITADRWIYNVAGIGGTGTVVVSKSYPAPNGLSQYYVGDNRTYSTTGSSAWEIYQTFISNQAINMVGREVTMSCWLYINVNASDFTISSRGAVAGSADSYSTFDYIIYDEDYQDLVDGWNYITSTFTIPEISDDNSYSLENGFFIGFYLVYSGADQLINNRVTQMKLEYGSVATPIIPLRYEDELLQCQRYYQKGYLGNHSAVGDGSSQMAFTLPIVTQMLISTCRFYADSDMYAHQLSDGTSVVKVMNSGDYDDFNGDTTMAGIFLEGLSGITDDSYSLNGSSTSGNTASGAVNYHIEGEPWILR